MTNRNEVVKYLIEQHYNDDPDFAARLTGFSKQQINNWISGKNTPQVVNVKRLIHHAFSPEFMIIAEYRRIDKSESETSVRNQLSNILKGHESASGIYAFYDSMANLIYVGKSDGNLLSECYQQIRAPIKRNLFPSGATQPETRMELVRFISAYYVRSSDFVDHAKHVESLILRISKPVLNRNVGNINYFTE